MKIIVISFTANGGKTALLLQSKLNADGFIIATHPVSGLKNFNSLREITRLGWQKYDALVFIGACGIAVRAVAPYIHDKAHDRAVISTDEKGGFVIPLLSGHIGGANELAKKIASVTGGTAVITTATDINNKFAVDLFAARNNLCIGDTKIIKEISSRVLDKKEIGLYSDYELLNVPDCFAETSDAGICISHENKKPFHITLNLYPKSVIIGIGCKKNSENIEETLLNFLNKNNINLCSIADIATIDIKKNEKGINSFCEKHSLPLMTFSAKELGDTKGNFSSSEFVKKTVGVDNVCERAVCAAGAELIYKKYAGNGVTAAAGTLKLYFDFERDTK